MPMVNIYCRILKERHGIEKYLAYLCQEQASFILHWLPYQPLLNYKTRRTCLTNIHSLSMAV